MSATPPPRVDIVISNFNYGRFLGAALESACGQTHPAVSVIAVDDGSSDDSRDVLAGFRDRAKVVLGRHGGQAAALNAGLRHCRGDLVIFLDADDVLLPDAAARAAAAFAADPAVVKVQWRMRVIDADGRATGELKPAPHLPLPQGDLRAAELAYPFDLPWLPTSANAFRLSRLRRILPIPEAAYPVCGADWHLLHLATLLGPVVSLDQVGTSYRVHGANNYEPAAAVVDLPHLRQTIGFAATTSAALLALAAELGLAHPARILSVSDLANRLISLRLAPDSHPLAADTVGSLLRDAAGAIHRRADAAAPLKALFAAWFAAMAVAPPPLARRLAAAMLFPALRPRLNSLLGRLQRPQRKRAG